MKTIFIIAALLMGHYTYAQQPRYTEKHFVNSFDTIEFKYIRPQGDGFSRTFLLTSVTCYDLDDDSTTFLKTTDSVFLCIEGYRKGNKREGVYTFYLIDKDDHTKRYRLWEQTFKNDKLDGQWRTYTLRGTLFSIRTFSNNLLIGLSQNYWIDGKTVLEEFVYQGDEQNYLYKDFYPNKNIQSEFIYKNGKLNGICKKYYPGGTIQEYAEFKDGAFHGTRRYYYDNGQVWIEQNYKDGKYWEVVANYTKEGKKRDAGTLKNGNGTVIYYDEDGSIRETETLRNGEVVK